ncbi:MAG: ABC transporter ATP-binding protein [Actinomycetota bacterium]
MPHVLEVRDVSIRFGGLQALDEVSIDVGEWEIVGLIGPNGAGKTTLFNCLSGIYSPDRGHIRYRGEDITKMASHRRVGLGMGRTWQALGAEGSLTVIENVLTAQHLHAGYSAMAGVLGAPVSFSQERLLRENAEEILFFLGLLPFASERVADLPYGTQKLCDLAMALATDPELLLLDEPSSGMGPEEAEALAETLRFLRDSLNLTILMIEHHVPLVVGVCDFVYCLNFGRVLAAGRPEQIQRHPEVIAAYLGDEATVADRSSARSRSSGKESVDAAP